VTRGIDPPEVEGYQWDGWKLIMIAKLNTDGTFHSRKWSCVWRPDVGSSLYARTDWMRAGGVGGVAWLQTGAVQSYSYGIGGAEVHVPLADHMGNVRHYYQFKASGKTVTGQLVASYEYDAFGREVRAWGTNTPVTSQPPGLPANRPWADLLPFHYSSKLRDADSGFNYYGYRFYDPGAGRWLNRDPIGEEGGMNLCGMVGNDGVGRVDVLGLSPGGERYPTVEGLKRAFSAELGVDSSLPPTPNSSPRPKFPSVSLPPGYTPKPLDEGGVDPVTDTITHIKVGKSGCGCNPCPRPIFWEAENVKPGDHGSTGTTHWHAIRWSQVPLGKVGHNGEEECTCVRARPSFPSDPRKDPRNDRWIRDAQFIPGLF